MKEQERIKMWKAEQARKRLKLRRWRNLSTLYTSACSSSTYDSVLWCVCYGYYGRRKG